MSRYFMLLPNIRDVKTEVVLEGHTQIADFHSHYHTRWWAERRGTIIALRPNIIVLA